MENQWQSLDAAQAAAMKAPAGQDTAAAAPVETNEGPTTLGEAFSDTGRAAFHAVDSVGRGMIDTVTQGILPMVGIDVIPEFPKPTIVDQPKYAVNKIAKDITAYGISLYAGGQIAKAAGAAPAVLNTVKGMAAQSALGVGLTADPHAEGLANLAEQYHVLESPITEYLAHTKDESFAAGKLRAITEDVFGSALGMSLFKVIQYGKASMNGLLKAGSKEAEKASTELATALQQLNEGAEQGTIAVGEKYPHLLAPEEKPLNLSNPKLSPDDKLDGFKQLDLDTLKIVDSMHPDEVNLSKVQTIRDAIRAGKGKDFPPIDVEHSPSGGYNVVDGRHRLHAAREEGYTSITANVERVFDPGTQLSPELRAKATKQIGGDLKSLDKMSAQAGGPEELAKVAAKSFKGQEAFNLTPEQYRDFEKRMLDNVGAGEMNDLYTKSLPEGAFNYAKMENRGDVHATLQSLAEVIAPQLQKTGKTNTVMSFREMQQTAQLFGSKPDVMQANLRSWGVDAKNIPATFLAAKNWSQSLANEIFRDARSIAIMGSGGETAKLEMMRKVTILSDLEGMMKSVQTAAARTTAAGRIRTAPTYSGKDMLAMLDEFGGVDKVAKLAEKLAMTEGNPVKIAKMLRVSWLRKVLDTHNELWINSMLSGVSTHVVNIGTAGVNTFLKPGNMALGGLIRGDMDSVSMAVGTWKGMGNVYKDAWSFARKAWAIERPLISVTDKQLEIESTISAGNYNLNPESWLGQGVNWMGKAARIPSRFLGAEDEFWKQLSYRGKLHSQATQEAMKLVRAGQLDPNKMVDVLTDGVTKKVSEVDNYIQNKFNEGFDYEQIPEFGAKPTPTRGTDEKALQYANEATFTQKLKVPTWLGNRSFAETMYQAANSHPMLRGTVLPFVKVPANLLREAASYTPGIAQLRKQFWSDMAEGGERASEAVGKMATGSMLLGGAVYLAVEGKITGGAPTDPDIRGRMYDKNWQPYSFVTENADGTKTYTPFARFDPFGLVFGIVGDIAQTFQHVNEESRHGFAAAATMAVANLLNSRSYLKGMVDALDVLSGGQGQDGIDKMTRIMNQRAASYVPNFARMGVVDTELKEIRSMMDALMAKTPGLSQSVPAKRNYFGNKVMSPVGWPWHAILPSKQSTESTDPATLELARLSDGPAQAHFSVPEKRIGTLYLTKYTNKDGVTAFDRMMEKLSETDFNEKMNALVTSPSYLAGNDGNGYYPGSKVQDIKRLESKYHKLALKETLKEFQDQAGELGYDLRDMYQIDRKNARASKHGRDVTEFDRLLELNQ